MDEWHGGRDPRPAADRREVAACARDDAAGVRDDASQERDAEADLRDGRARLRRGRAALVFQSFHLLPNMTAEENVSAPLELAQRPGAVALARCWLERVGLGARRSHYPHQMSGGEQQRVALARAFINRPRLLFADEPTGNLDAETSDRVVQLLLDLNAQAGTALVLVTHNPELAALTGRTIRLRDGAMEQ